MPIKWLTIRASLNNNFFAQPTIVTDNYTWEKCLPPQYPYAKVCSVVVSMTAYSRTNFKDSGELLLQQLQLGRRQEGALCCWEGGGIPGFLQLLEVHYLSIS